jgi:tetratricopeptide (TPR) repeat protein
MYTRVNHYIAVILYLFVSIIIVRQPLIGNFGYEYAALFAVIASLVSGFYAIRDERRKSDIPPVVRLRIGLIVNLLYLVVPVAVVFIVALPELPCDPVEGLTFYALLPVISVIFSYMLGWLVSMLFKWGRTVFVCFVILSFIFSILSTLLQPKIFFYNPFIGFFPGLSYDQLLPVTSTLVWYRGYTIFLALLFVLLMYMLRFTPIRAVAMRDRIRLIRHAYANSYVSIFITIGVILLFVQMLSRGALGFSTTYGQLESSLGNVYETRSFSIHYSSDSFNEHEIQWVALEHEFQRHQAMQKLGVMNIGKIRSYLYPNPELKRALIGPATTNIAKPWSREIHINADSYQRSLLHELAHVVAGHFGMPVLRISNSTALIEGVAMTAEGVWGNRTLHEHAAALLQFEVVRDPASLLDNKVFAQHYSPISYVFMGSFVQYLIDRYGIQRVRSAYAWSDYESAFDRPREQLASEWINFLRRINVSERQRLKTMIYFKRPSLFGLKCPRALARINRAALEYLSQGDYNTADELFQRSWNMVRNGTALEGLIRTAFHRGEYERVINYFDDERLQEEFPQIIPSLFRTIGDVFALQGDYKSAEEVYRRLLAIDYSDTLNELMRIRLLALETPDDADLWRLLYHEQENQESILQSLTGTSIDDTVSAGLQWVIGRFIHIKQDFENSAQYQRELRERFEGDFFKYLTTIRAGESLFYTGRFQEAMIEFWQALNYTDTPAAKHVIYEWLDRIEYANEFGSTIWESIPPWR